MKTNELIAILSHDIQNQKPWLTLTSTGVLLIGVGLLVTAFSLGLRPELTNLTFTTSFCFKTFILAALAMLSLNDLKASSVPLGRFTLKFLGVGVAALFLVALVHEWTTHSVHQIEQLFLLPNFKDCLKYVLLYGTGLSLVLLTVTRKQAPLHAESTAGLIGIAAASIGGLGYSIHCPVDSPTFILVAYGVPILVLYAVSRAAFKRFLSW